MNPRARKEKYWNKSQRSKKQIESISKSKLINVIYIICKICNIYKIII